MNIFETIIVQPIFNLLLTLYSLIPGGDFGVALIVFTILVRFALWPLIKKQLHQTRAMQKMQPELAKIKKQANGNKQVEAVMMMELYKKYDISPFGSIGILLIQLPIFIALFQVIRIFTTNRDLISKFTYGFLQNLEPVKNLIAHPENFNEKLFGFIDLSKVAIGGNPVSIDIVLLVLVIIAAITQYIMAKQTTPKRQDNNKKSFKQIMSEAADGKQPEQGEMNAIMMNNMTKFMPILMLVIMIPLPGTLVLYYTVSNLVAVLQQRYILSKDAEEMIEIADNEPVVISGKKATAKARAKQAREAVVTRIVAKDDNPRKEKQEK